MANYSSLNSPQKLVDDYFWDLESQVGLRTPNNINQEKIKFFDSKYSYNPQFSYSPVQKIEFEKNIEKSIQNIENQEIRKLYSDKLKEFKLRYDLAISVGRSASEFTRLSIKLHGKPTDESLRVAQKITSQMPPINFDRNNINNIRFKRLKKEIRKYIKQNDLKGKLHIKHQQAVANAVSVSKKSGKVNVSDNYIADKDELVDILFHELETHMRRLENGSTQEHKIFKIGTAGYLKYEEGLAPITGHVFKKNQFLWHPALLIIAIDQALQSDFSTVFDAINSIIKEPFQSWTYAVRAKSGLTDTSKAGAHTKDLYLKWAIKAMRELVSHPDILKYAYNGKASFSQLKQFTHIPDNFQPKITIPNISQLAKANYLAV